MEPRWVSVICLAALAIIVQTAAMPTEDALVLAKTTEASLEALEETTAGPEAAIRVMEMSVKSEVSLRYAHTAVVTRVQNPGRRAQQTTFHVLLPETAFISNFIMTLSGVTYKAYVKEKEEAKRIYTQAVSHGMAAAHISARVRDSNHFTVSINVEPKSEAVFNLTYEELLVRRNGVYNHAINLYAGAVVPKLDVTVHIKESQKLSVLRVPEVKTGNEIDANENDAEYSNSLLLNIQKSNDGKEATISFTPDREEQLRLMKIYAEKIKESASSSHNGKTLSDDNSTTGMLGQFVVQYDVERPENGEILLNDGYFVHFYTPPGLKPLNKHVVFVLDTSGSMAGRKIKQLKDAMLAILDDLKPNDYFNIVEFSTKVRVHKISKPVKEPSKHHFYNNDPVALAPPSIASTINIEKAKNAVSRFIARGGTNIYEALDVAVDIINKLNETKQVESVTVNGTEDTKEEELQPIIIFLTDGDATVGETDTNFILSSITEKNSEGRKAAIFSLAFGQEADRRLLRKISTRNAGFMRHIYEEADASLQLRHFYSQVSSPLLADANFIYPPEQIKNGSVTQHKFRTVFMGSELVVAGEVAPGIPMLEPYIHAYSLDEIHRHWRPYEVRKKVEVTKTNNFLPLERLWAYLTIKQLLEEHDEENPEKQEPEKRALDIALKYGFVTPLTSLVVVKPNATDAIDAESIHRIPVYRHHFGIPPPPPPQHQYNPIPSQTPVWNPLFPRFGGIPFLGYRPTSNWAPLYSNHKFSADTPTGSGSSMALEAPIPTSTISLEEIHNFKGYTWALNLFNSETNSLEFVSNGKNVALEISQSSIPPKDNEDSECVASVGATNESSVCVYLTRCAAAKHFTSEQYEHSYCIVQNKYAGVCCPKNEVDKV